MKKRSRILSLLMVLIVAVMISGCGKGDDSQKSDKKKDKNKKGESIEELISDIDNYVYKSETIINDSEGSGRCKIFNDNLYMMYCEYSYPEGEDNEEGTPILYTEGEADEKKPAAEAQAEAADEDIAVEEPEESFESDESKLDVKIVCSDLNGNKKSDLSLSYTNLGINDFVVDKNGNIYFLTEEYALNDSTGEYTNNFMISGYDKDGNSLFEKEITGEGEQDYFYAYTLKLTDTGFLLVTNGGVDVYDDQFNKKNHIGEINGNVEWGSSFILRDGRIAAMVYGDQKPSLATYDLETGKKQEDLEVPINLWNYNVSAGNVHDLILSNSTGVFYYNLGDKEITKFIDYVASDLCCYNIYNIVEIDDNTFYGSFYDELTEGGANVTAKFTKVAPEKSAARKTLTLGGMYIGTDIKKNIILFNRGNDNYRIIVKDYSNNTEDGDYYAMLDGINNDILAGTMPDIMLLNTSMDISNYFAKGAFEPLDSYMENDSEFDRSDYMENVLKAMTFDGKLYCITPTFTVNTLVGKKSVVGDKNLSLTELENVAKDLGDNVKVFSSDTTKEQFIRNVMYYDKDEFIDMTTGEVKFDSPEFIKVLEFTDNLPITPPDYEEDNWEEYEAEFRLNRALVMTMGLYDFRDSMSYYRTVMFGEELGYIGFPTANGSGNTIGFDNALAISADSQYKDGAWEFIRTYISDDFQDKITYGFPINKAALKKRGQEATKPQTYIDENGKEQVVKESYWLDGKEVEVDPPTQADIDAFIGVLETADSLVNYNESITNIILEEASGYFDGQKSAEDVAKVIQSKVQIYVNENR
ncbi:MAG: extracellular solute-binding protein [Lachnospiraceae bacterium]|nr:extracellular solute-binding protein [Lachnospiraceae bacterium]